MALWIFDVDKIPEYFLSISFLRFFCLFQANNFRDINFIIKLDCSIWESSLCDFDKWQNFCLCHWTWKLKIISSDFEHSTLFNYFTKFQTVHRVLNIYWHMNWDDLIWNVWWVNIKALIKFKSSHHSHLQQWKNFRIEI